MKTLACIALTLCLTACSPLEVLKQVAPSVFPTAKGIEVDAQIGDRENKIEVNTSTVGPQIEKAEVVNIEQIPVWVLLLLVLGWVLPTPTDMIRGMKGWLVRTLPPA